MAKVHLRGGTKGHFLKGVKHKDRHRESTVRKRWRQNIARLRQAFARTQKAEKLIEWAESKLSETEDDLNIGRITRSTFFFKQLAIDDILSAKLPKEGILVEDGVVFFKGEERHTLSEEERKDIMEQLFRTGYYTEASVSEKVRKWRAILEKTRPKR